MQHLITNKCTLKCKECCCYIPYYSIDNRWGPLSFYEYKIQLDALLKSIDKILIYAFMGGECFLAKELPKMVEYACQQSKISIVQIPTNGTIIPSGELLNVLRKYKQKVKVNMSNYSSNDKILNHYQDIICLFNRNNVSYEFADADKTFWRSKYGIMEEGGSCQNNFKQCYMKRCVHYAEGKLYHCPLGYYFDKNNDKIVLGHYDFCNVVNNKNAKQDILNLLISENCDVCQYCNLMTHPVPVAEQLE